MTSGGSDLTRLLEYLKASRGFDFTGYKVSTLSRRIQKRMGEVGVESYADYIDFLEVHPGEHAPLFNTVLIKVTSFFRDDEPWRTLAAELPVRLARMVGEERPIRVWSAGCASGEEAYSIAMLLCEALGEEGFRQRVKIYGTDADEEALAAARLGAYDERHVAEVPPDLLGKYFEPSKGRHAFRADLRRALIFGRHDLVQDAAISRVDLLICRNVLMYFNLEAQGRILSRFHFALNPAGLLFLGRAETLLSHSTHFKPLDLKRRLFERLPGSSLRERLLAITPVAVERFESDQDFRQARLRERTFDSGTVAQLVIDREGHLVMASDRARELFQLGHGDLGRLLQDLEVSYRPVELRSAIESAYAGGRVVRLPNALWESRGETLHLDIQVVPLVEPGGDVLGVSVSFVDLTQAKRLEDELERANHELMTAYEELQSAKEELETTNEELQSTVEELETTNEELQSANEELETMNEELQSTNEELRTMNDDGLLRSEELHRLNAFLATILANLQAGIVVVDRSLAVLVWSQRAEDLWGMRSDEAVGRPFLKLDIGLPVERLRQPLRDCLDGGAPRQVVTLEGVNRRGKPILCNVTCSLLVGESESEGESDALLIMEELSAG